MKESVADKAKRLLSEGKVNIFKTTYARMRAIIKGDHGSYRVEVLRDGRFNCECNNYVYTDSTVECSHVLAIKMHPMYRSWWPYTVVNGELVKNDAVESEMPIFSTAILEANKHPSKHFSTISEEEFNEVERGGANDITHFIRKCRFVDGMTYEQIVHSVLDVFGVEVSKTFIADRVKKEPKMHTTER